MKTSPDDVRDRLERIAQQLAALSFPTSPISVEDAHWLASSLEAYLQKEAPSLDAALGLVTPVGGQKKMRKAELICEVWAAGRGKLTAEQIAALVHENNPHTFPAEPEPRQVRRAVGLITLDTKKWSDLEKLTPEAIAAWGADFATRKKTRT